MADRLVLDAGRVPAVLDGEVVQEQVQVVSGFVGRAEKVGRYHGSSSPRVAAAMVAGSTPRVEQCGRSEPLAV